MCLVRVCPSLLFVGSTVYIPSFDGTSYLELQPLASFLQPSAAGKNPTATAKDTAVILHLTVKTGETQGTVLYSEYILSPFFFYSKRFEAAGTSEMKAYKYACLYSLL